MKRLTLSMILLGLLGGCGALSRPCGSEQWVEALGQFRRLESCTESKSIVAGGRMNEELEAMEILDLSKLTHVTGGIHLYDFPNLRELRLPNLEVVDSPSGVAQLTLTDLPMLEVLELGSLRRVSNWETTPAALVIGGAPKVSELDLSTLEFASNIGIGGMNGLRTLSIPEMTDRNVAINIGGNLSLETIEIGDATSAGQIGLVVSGNPSLRRLAIPGEVIVEETELSDLPLLTDLDLGPSPDFGLFLKIYRTGLQSLSFDDDEMGILEVQENDDLVSVSFPDLASLRSRLVIEDNATLSELDFSALTDVDSIISIVNNPLLPTCEATAVTDQAGVGSANYTTGNLADACGP